MVKGMKIAGVGIIAIALVLLVSVFGIRADAMNKYVELHPDDTTGPCEGWDRDARVCEDIRLLDSLWIPGWIVLFLGIILLVLAFILDYARQQPKQQMTPQYSQQQPQQYPPQQYPPQQYPEQQPPQQQPPGRYPPQH